MFNPTRDESRLFLFDLWDKHRAGAAMSPLETMAFSVVLEHPEYHAVLEDRERYLDRDWQPEGGETNPFLHLMMHVAIEEQLSIDHPHVPVPLALVGLADGGVATSTSLCRRWTVGGEVRHHLIDPRTGEPSTSDLALVTVVAGGSLAA